METKLKEYQIQAYQFLKNNSKAGLFLEMGLGKTLITLLALNDLFKEKKIKKALIITSLRIANNVWNKEAEKWKETRHLKIRPATGTGKKRLEILKDEADIIITTKDFLKVIVDNNLLNLFDCIVFDESSYFKNTNTVRFRKIKKHIVKFKYVYILSGTPCAEDLISLWSQIYLLDNGARLYKTKTEFLRTFFNEVRYTNYSKYYLRNKADIEIFDRIKDIVYIKKNELEEPTFVDYYFDLDKNARTGYDMMMRDSFLPIEDDYVFCSNIVSKVNKLAQICNGGIYDSSRVFHFISSERIKLLGKILEQIKDNVIIVIKYNFDYELIKKAFPDALKFEDHLIDDWNRGKIKKLIIHPKSCGHGLNLQYGGSTLIWYSLTYSLEEYLQVNSRIYRTGQDKEVKILRILASKTIEEDIDKILKKKLTLNNFFLSLKL